ncbi:hypothetical protein XENOCAPTIV_025160 [Xenoophorus captivus]|uniref:Uncharacterized protein n=1 Tax=Xenoophorus captivus TaxID=1517983 RepID=A0ABV0SJT8_9TELE
MGQIIPDKTNPNHVILLSINEVYNCNYRPIARRCIVGSPCLWVHGWLSTSIASGPVVSPLELPGAFALWLLVDSPRVLLWFSLWGWAPPSSLFFFFTFRFRLHVHCI